MELVMRANHRSCAMLLVKYSERYLNELEERITGCRWSLL